MYIFTIKTDREDYSKYNNKQCWIPYRHIREDGYVEVYVPDCETFLLLRPSELED